MNRGSAPGLPLVIVGAPASMRPRFMNRGSPRDAPPAPARPPRFNEAPIHESGKSLLLVDDVHVMTEASMRPRFMNRGSASGRSPGSYRSSGFNEAPIHESGKYATRPQGRRRCHASMRPRFMNRGSDRGGHEECRPPLPASMRPRFMNRGSMDSIVQAWGISPEASMRPRFMNRGSGRYNQKLALHKFGFNEAPIHESGKLRLSPADQRLPCVLQ